jgi:hypothetical protein
MKCDLCDELVDPDDYQEHCEQHRCDGELSNREAFKCATFDQSEITPEIRAKMDEGRRRAEQSGTGVYDASRVETGWLIEHGMSYAPSYLSICNGHWKWTKDHNEALRFARKIDAERAATTCSLKVDRIAEHSWS